MTAGMGKSTQQSGAPKRRRRGFERASGLLTGQVRKASEERGFAVTRLLTHWDEIVGADLGAFTRPVKVGYSRQGLGATLTVLTTGARAPELQAMLPTVKDRVNACYGYAAISRIKITQTAATGFAEGQASFGPENDKPRQSVDPKARAQASAATRDISDQRLQHALENLGANILKSQH
ncbi:MAG: DciA family protein [Pseudomonadota bacterium]